MGFSLAEAYVEIKGRDSGLGAALGKARSDTNRFDDATKKTGSGIAAGLLKAAAAAFTFAKAAQIIKGIVSASEDSQDAMVRLRAALKNTGQEVEANATRMAKAADEIQDKYNIGDEQTKGLMTIAVNMGRTADEAENMSKAAIGLAEIMRVDTATAMDTLVKAGEGNFMMLQRQIPALKNMTTNEEKLAAVQKLAANGLRERADATHTARGETERASIAFTELGKSIANQFLPAMGRAAEATTSYINAMNSSRPEGKVFWLDLTERTLTYVQAVDQAKKATQDFLHLDSSGTQKDVEQIQKEIDAVEQKIQDVGKAAVAATNKDKSGTVDAIALHEGLNKKLEKTRSLMSVQDVWTKAVEAVLNVGKKKGGAAGAAAAGNPPVAGGGGGTAGAAGAAATSHGPTEMHDRSYYGREFRRDRNFFQSLDMDPGNRAAMEKSGMGASLPDRERKYGRDFAIYEFGSVAKEQAERQKRDSEQGIRRRTAAERAAIDGPYNKQRSDLDAAFKGHEDNPTYHAMRRKLDMEQSRAHDAYDAGAGSWSKEQIRSEKERIDKGYAPEIKRQEEELKKPIDVNATMVKDALQHTFVGKSDGRPIRVETKEGAELLKAVQQLNQLLPQLVGFK